MKFPGAAAAAIGLREWSDTPRVSVVIPAYNHAALCEKAIASALAQTLRPIEVIVVDDGSDPPCVIDNDDPAIRLIRLPLNRGPSAARNEGVASASGDWIAFLDADDIWEPDKLAVQLAGEKPNQNVLLACNVTLAVKGRRRPYNRMRPAAPLDRWVLVDGQSLQTSGLVLPTTLALAVPFDEGLRVYEDWDLVLRLARVGVSIEYEPRCLVTYVRPENSPALSRDATLFQAAWLSDPASPADSETRYHHYLVEVFRRHFREAPRAALATALELARQTRRPGRASAATLRMVWRKMIGRRMQPIDDTKDNPR
jgi:glycosyltransferase involved in cell wall biosynthesis